MTFIETAASLRLPKREVMDQEADYSDIFYVKGQGEAYCPDPGLHATHHKSSGYGNRIEEEGGPLRQVIDRGEVGVAWHVRYRHHRARRWSRALIQDVACRAGLT